MICKDASCCIEASLGVRAWPRTASVVGQNIRPGTEHSKCAVMSIQVPTMKQADLTEMPSQQLQHLPVVPLAMLQRMLSALVHLRSMQRQPRGAERTG